MRDFGSHRFPDNADIGLSLPNLADLMLVFATGLIAALAVAGQDRPQQREVETMESIDAPADAASADGAGLESAGQVFRDPKTGKLYIIE